MAKGIYENWGAITKGAQAAWSAIKVGAQAAWHAVSSFVVQALSSKSSNSTIKTGKIYYVDFSSNYKALKAA